MVLTIAPLLGASLIAASLTVDEFHNWYDCLGGAVTGTLCAFVAYRKTFAATWDFRFNHILLPRKFPALEGSKSLKNQARPRSSTVTPPTGECTTLNSTTRPARLGCTPLLRARVVGGLTGL